ncbi:MAG: DsbA family protein [Patescibacteria group bacterium]
MNKEKTNFILGLASGIAIVSLIGFAVMSMAYFQKEDISSVAAGEKNSDQVANEVKDNKPISPTPSPSPSKPAEIKVSDSDHIRGNKDAPITIVEYSDFQCSFCTKFHNTMKQAMANYPNEVRWVYKHFPLDSIHPYARKAGEASECANDQGKFWEYNDLLFANQGSINTSYLSTAAKELKLDIKKFEECLSSSKYANKVNDDFNEGKSLGVTGTPGSFLNGQALGGAVPYSQIESMIESLN